jgi:hypothetical protein
MCWRAYTRLTNMPTERVYQSQIKRVSEYLGDTTVATREMIHEATGLEPYVINRMINDMILTSSLNYDRNWLTLTKTVNTRKNHWGFYNHRIKKHSRTVPIFHIKRTAKGTLSYLASRMPWGISFSEAKELLGRDCDVVLKLLVGSDAIQVRLYNNEKIYLNRLHKKAELQMNHRKTNPRFNKDDADDDDDDAIGVITFEEFCGVFKRVLSEMDRKCTIPDSRLTALLLMFKTSRTLRTAELWIKHNPRIKDAIEMPVSIDHSTLCRAFNDVSEEFLKEIFHRLVLKLHDKGIITGRFLVVDATHIYAFRNTRKDTDEHPVEGAGWGNHHGSFFGYKVHIIIDAESEMPLGMIVSSGEDNDALHFIPLLEDFEKHYSFDEILAVLADGAYDKRDFREEVRCKTGGIFLPACNPRRNRILKMIKLMVKRLFEKHGDKIQSVQDGFRYLGQRFLTHFGIEFERSNESRLVEMIEERLHRPYRAAVERVFSRLKSMVSFERPKTRDIKSVWKIMWFCLMGNLVQALTAHEKGLSGSMRKRTMLA